MAVLSVHPLMADMHGPRWHVRFVPIVLQKSQKHSGDFLPKGETSDNRRSMRPQTRYRNRL
jgi:hypothetical protein